MIGWLLQHLQLIRKALRGRSESPRRLATAVALGVLLGLIPKGNLIAGLVAVAIVGSTTNVGVAMLTATVASFAAVLVDPFSHRIGQSILTSESLYPYWHALYQWPVVPWTNFNHTVVLGGLIVGLVLFYPAYRLSYAFFNRNNAKHRIDPEKPEADDALKPEEQAKEMIATPEAHTKEAIAMPELQAEEVIKTPEPQSEGMIASPETRANEAVAVELNPSLAHQASTAPEFSSTWQQP